MSVAIPSLRGAIAVPEWAKNELWRKSRVVPSLDLRFADLKSLVDATTGANLVTFSRASGGTYVGSDGLIKTAAVNEPRFTHDPVTGESLGLLVEEQRVNLLQRSEEFDNAIWGPVRGTVSANQESAPNGAGTADKLIAANGDVDGQLVQGATITSGATVTGSVYVKAGGLDGLELVLLSNNNTTPYGRSTINPNTGVITAAAFASNGATNASSSVQAFGNGWYRFSVTVTYPAVTAAGMRLSAVNLDASNGDGVKGVFLWGAQLEEGSFPTSYIPTTTSALTRAADVASISGSNFSSWYRQDGTTFYCEGKGASSAGAGYFGVDYGSFARGYSVANTINNEIRVARRDASGTYLNDYPALSSEKSKTAVYFSDAEASASVNGSSVSTATDVLSLSPKTTLRIGYQFIYGSPANNYLGGTLARLVVWPTRLPNEVLQAITL